MNTSTSTLTIVRHPLVEHKLAMLRDCKTPPALFCRLMHEVSMLLAYEMTRELATMPCEVETPLARLSARSLSKPHPALISILRAGNGLLSGFVELLPTAPVGMIGLYRDEETLEARRYYCKLPDGLDRRLCMVLDPMLATGHSACAAVELLKEQGARSIKFLCLLAAPEGVEHLQRNHPDVAIVTAAVDTCLDERGFIVPGLGDAGDRLFGTF